MYQSTLLPSYVATHTLSNIHYLCTEANTNAICLFCQPNHISVALLGFFCIHKCATRYIASLLALCATAGSHRQLAMPSKLAS